MANITTQKALRAAFWRDNPGASRKLITDYAGTGRMHCTDTRAAWVNYIDAQCRAGIISPEFAARATLRPGRVRREWEVQRNYGPPHGWETECTESTRAEALARLKEYRANGSGAYRLRVRRIIEKGE